MPFLNRASEMVKVYGRVVRLATMMPSTFTPTRPTATRLTTRARTVSRGTRIVAPGAGASMAILARGAAANASLAAPAIAAMNVVASMSPSTPLGTRSTDCSLLERPPEWDRAGAQSMGPERKPPHPDGGSEGENDQVCRFP